MTREIKFRAWDKFAKKIRDWEDLQERLWWDNPYFELLQYTGLKDKKGKDIYDGDIVEWTWGSKKSVELIVFEECKWKFKGKHKASLYNNNVGCKIIGNKFENPELLK